MRIGVSFHKRGVSTVVATVLLISIVVALAGLVFIWARGFILKAENQALADKACENIEFTQGQFCHDNESVEDFKTGMFENKTYIQFDVRNDASGSKLERFLILADYDGEIKSIPTLPFSEVESFSSETVRSENIDDFFNLKKISVAPKVSIKSKIFICDDKIQIASLEDIKEC